MREFPAAVTTASRRGRARGRCLVLACLATVVAAPACKLNQQGVAPPLDRIAFPASAIVDPDGRWLYVANSNSDLRYNSGTLVAVDLDAAFTRIAPTVRSGAEPLPTWPVCAGADRVRLDTDPAPCCWDYLDHEILNCDERLYIPPASTVKIGSFSAGMQFQSFVEPKCDPSKAPAEAATAVLNAATTRHDCNAHCPGDAVEGRLFIGVRGNSSLTYVDTGRVTDPDPKVGTRPAFSCSDPATASADDPSVCQIVETTPDTNPIGGAVPDPIHVPDEPYALTLDESQDLLYVGNLRGDTMHPQTGGISLFDVRRTAPRSTPTFLGPTASFFNPDANGNFGITSLTLRQNDQVYASSRYGINVVNVVPSLDASRLCSQDPRTITLVAGSDIYTTPLVGAEIRGIQFVSDERAFVLQRVPPALIGFDVSKTHGPSATSRATSSRPARRRPSCKPSTRGRGCASS